jgi:hypothetical protein
MCLSSHAPAPWPLIAPLPIAMPLLFSVGCQPLSCACHCATPAYCCDPLILWLVVATTPLIPLPSLVLCLSPRHPCSLAGCCISSRILPQLVAMAESLTPLCLSCSLLAVANCPPLVATPAPHWWQSQNSNHLCVSLLPEQGQHHHGASSKDGNHPFSSSFTSHCPLALVASCHWPSPLSSMDGFCTFFQLRCCHPLLSLIARHCVIFCQPPARVLIIKARYLLLQIQQKNHTST